MRIKLIPVQEGQTPFYTDVLKRYDAYVIIVAQKYFRENILGVEIEDDAGTNLSLQKNSVLVIVKDNETNKFLLSNRLETAKDVMQCIKITHSDKQELLPFLVFSVLHMPNPAASLLHTHVLGHVKPSASVLEICLTKSNVFVTVAALLDNTLKYVLVCPDDGQIEYVNHVKQKNGFAFAVEKSLISDYPLRFSDDGYFVKATEETDEALPVINWDAFHSKYDVVFDTLVVDCANALFHSLQSNTTWLNAIKTVILSNNYSEMSECEFVTSVLRKHGFMRVFRNAFGGGPCHECFFEIYVRHSTT